MKQSIVVLALCLLLVLSVTAQKPSEVEAIKAVIEKETNAFFNIDYDTWMNSWIHAPHAYWSFVDSTGVVQYEGWKAIEIGFTDYFITSKPTSFKIERVYQEVRVYGSGAFARFKQVVTSDGVRGPEQTEIRILEKDKNTWKIVLVGVLKNSKSVVVN
jgi:hypothetical protein